MAKFTQRIGRAPRSCGPCVACCVTPEIVELDKPEWTTCPKLNDGDSERRLVYGGCSEYAARPEVCKWFRCAWLRHYGRSHADRPDRAGFYVTFQDTEFGRVARFHESYDANASVRPLSELTRIARDYARRLNLPNTHICVTITKQGCSLLGGPEANVRKYCEYLWKMKAAGKETKFPEFDNPPAPPGPSKTTPSDKRDSLSALILATALIARKGG